MGTRYKRAWERKETRGELRKPILGRKSTEICGKPAGNLQETRRKPAGNPQETRRKLAGNLQET